MSAQINEHNVAESAHENRFAKYLPLSGGTMTGELVIGNEKNIDDVLCNTISFLKAPNVIFAATSNEDMQGIVIRAGSEYKNTLTVSSSGIGITSTNV